MKQYHSSFFLGWKILFTDFICCKKLYVSARCPHIFGLSSWQQNQQQNKTLGQAVFIAIKGYFIHFFTLILDLIDYQAEMYRNTKTHG